MNINKQPWQLRALLSSGLLLTTMPLLFKEFLPPFPDLARGMIEGFGIGMEVCALILMRRNNRCRSVSAEEGAEF